ncbi:ankyrin repeat domain-containing protein [Coxiella burnetii]|uniref:ankyrin repeat domain-containing protein n=1 Tax=Coxiella burnetii TaxID=777 RepID=UPI0000DAE13B|nr:ankyrin repeat domain-containing protein [Coxiella burnetii]
MSRTYNAAADGDLYRLQSLIKEGENLAPRLDGRTPLFIAAEGGHIPVVDYLLSDQNPRKAEVIQFIDLRWNKTGATATYQAAQTNHLEVLQRLVENGASLAPRPDGCSPLWVAAQDGHARVVNYLLSDQNPRKVEVIQFIDSGWNKTGATATYQAAKDGHLGVLQRLVENGASLAPCPDGCSPLWIASQNGHVDVVHYLFSDRNPRKAEVIKFIDSRWNETGATATYQAAQNGHLGVLQRLVEKGVSLEPCPDGCSPLWAAAEGGYIRVVDYLLSDQNPRKAEVILFIDACWIKTGASAAFQAAINGHLEVLQRLVENGASLAPRPDGCSPLWIASQNGHVDVVHYLLSDRNPRKTEVIESINSRWSKAGGAALNAAVSKNREEIVLSLLAAGASPNQPHKKKNNKQESALQCALQNQQYGIALALLAYDSNINPSSQELIIKYKTQLTDNLLDLLVMKLLLRQDIVH